MCDVQAKREKKGNSHFLSPTQNVDSACPTPATSLKM